MKKVGRPLKVGEVMAMNLFPNSEPSVKSFLLGIGAKGYGVLARAGELACGQEGFYLPYTDATFRHIATFLNESIPEVEEVLRFAVESGVFDSEKFKTHRILTCRTLQLNYFKQVTRRTKITVNPDYLLDGIMLPKNVVLDPCPEDKDSMRNAPDSDKDSLAPAKAKSFCNKNSKVGFLKGNSSSSFCSKNSNLLSAQGNSSKSLNRKKKSRARIINNNIYINYLKSLERLTKLVSSISPSAYGQNKFARARPPFCSKIGSPPRTKKNAPQDDPSLFPLSPPEKTPQRSPEVLAREERFRRFWVAYPKKRAKARAFAVWLRLNPSEAMLQTMLQKIEEFKNSYDWMKEGGKYIPYPEGWLNGAGWEDEVEVRVDEPKPKKRGFVY